ncbi:MAG TPA: LysR substrate-binding domain-containing protein [Acidimicrobiales bacterium]|nr:LysR substrate-binding domain-containing protein [Acidimicrobiales bacterium]
MNLQQVAYVVAAADLGSFTRAAASIPVTQPSLSQGIRTLERELGAPLFDRLGRQVRLTAAGRVFLGPARRLLRDAAVARDAVSDVAGLRAGRLDIVTLHTLAVDPLATMVGAFRARHPGVAVHIAEPDAADAAIEGVHDGAYEIGLVELPAAPGLVVHELAAQELLAVCPPGTPIVDGRLPVRRLAEMPLITTPVGTATRRLVDDACATADVTATVAVETGHREALLPLVLAGAGTTFLPSPRAQIATAQGAVVASVDPPLNRTIGLIHREGPLSPAATAFVAVALEG